jgi:hypothetical protein
MLPNVGAERDADTEAEQKQKGDMLFTDDRLTGYRSIVHKTYFVLEYVVSALRMAHSLHACASISSGPGHSCKSMHPHDRQELQERSVQRPKNPLAGSRCGALTSASS